MLLQSQVCDTNGIYEIELLPALPKAWPDGHVTGLRARGGFEVEMTWAGGGLQAARIRSLLGQPLHLRLGERVVETATKRGQILRFNSNLAPARS